MCPFLLTLPPILSTLELYKKELSMFQNIGLGEILIVAVVLMVLFGGQKFPELAKGIAQAMREFRTALNENEDDDKETGKSKEKTTKKKE